MHRSSRNRERKKGLHFAERGKPGDKRVNRNPREDFQKKSSYEKFLTFLDILKGLLRVQNGPHVHKYIAF